MTREELLQTMGSSSISGRLALYQQRLPAADMPPLLPKTQSTILFFLEEMTFPDIAKVDREKEMQKISRDTILLKTVGFLPGNERAASHKTLLRLKLPLVHLYYMYLLPYHPREAEPHIPLKNIAEPHRDQVAKIASINPARLCCWFIPEQRFLAQNGQTGGDAVAVQCQARQGNFEPSDAFMTGKEYHEPPLEKSFPTIVGL